MNDNLKALIASPPQAPWYYEFFWLLIFISVLGAALGVVMTQQGEAKPADGSAPFRTQCRKVLALVLACGLLPAAWWCFLVIEGIMPWGYKTALDQHTNQVRNVLLQSIRNQKPDIVDVVLNEGLGYRLSARDGASQGNSESLELWTQQLAAHEDHC